MDYDKNLESSYVKSYYDSFLSKYDKEYSHYRWQAGPVERLHFSQTNRTLSPYLDRISGQVLEIGGGDGIWTRKYIEKVHHLTFLDISTEMVARAKKRLAKFENKISYVNEDFLKNNFANNTFDQIVSIRNLEYFIDKKSFISEVERLLKKDGKFILVTKSPQYGFYDKARKKTLHTGQIDIKNLIKIIKNQGLQVIDVKPAIFGKAFYFFPTRLIFNFLHKIILKLPKKILPMRILSYLSESFMIYAKK